MKRRRHTWPIRYVYITCRLAIFDRQQWILQFDSDSNIFTHSKFFLIQRNWRHFYWIFYWWAFVVEWVREWLSSGQNCQRFIPRAFPNRGNFTTNKIFHPVFLFTFVFLLFEIECVNSIRKMARGGFFLLNFVVQVFKRFRLGAILITTLFKYYSFTINNNIVFNQVATNLQYSTK